MTEPSDELNGIPFTARLVVDERMRRHLLFTMGRVRLGHPVILAMVGIGVLGGLLAAAVGEVAMSLVMFLLPASFVLAFVMPALFARSAVVPVGSTIETGFGPHSFVVRGPNLTGEIAYTTYRKAKRVGDVVALFIAGSTAYSLLPGQLFPAHAVDAVNHGVSAPATYGPSTTAGAARFVVPAGWAARAAWAFVAAAHRRPRAWKVYGFLLVLGVVLSVLFSSPWWLLYPGVGAPAVLLGTWWRTRRALLAGLPVGSAVELTVGETAITVVQPSGRREVPYSAYTDVRVTDELVLLRHRLGGQVGVFPRELFTPETLATVRAAVEGTMASGEQ